jgi:hypothetical protein
MPQLELLGRIVKFLTENSIQYMLTGSIVSSLQGIPRSTHDIDIIISITKDDIPKIIRAFPLKNFYVNENSIKEAVINKSQFNIIDINEGDKIDFWILTENEFDKIRFERKQKLLLFNFEAYISTAEDTILQKLYWSKQSGGSKKQFNDALNVFEIQYGKLDLKYMADWSKKLGIESLFDKIQSDAEIG